METVPTKSHLLFEIFFVNFNHFSVSLLIFTLNFSKRQLKYVRFPHLYKMSLNRFEKGTRHVLYKETKRLKVLLAEHKDTYRQLQKQQEVRNLVFTVNK